MNTTKINGSEGQQLVMREIVLVPGGEWSPRLPGWALVHLTQGVVYWMHSRTNQELASGSLLILSHQAPGVIRTSQLGQAVLHYYYVEPGKLTGLVTLAEQRILEEAAKKEASSFRLIPAAEPLAQKFRGLCQERTESRLILRLKMLEIFIRAFEQDLSAKSAEPVGDPSAKSRLQTVLKQMPAADMVDLSFADLVAKVGCCPRHFGRVFQDVVGVSFREKQTEVRLGRAQELLSTTQSKVLEVAMESGYQSLSLFNLMFKKRFGTTPGKWRQRLSRRRVSN